MVERIQGAPKTLTDLSDLDEENPQLPEPLGARPLGALFGAWIGDALAMPAHWYYDRRALREDYGHLTDFTDPKSPHPDSIFWRSSWDAPSDGLDILGEQRRFWGRRGIHYHQLLRAGENTLTIQVASEAWKSLLEHDAYVPKDFLERYIDLLTHPARHRDTYIEECHRGFFTNLGNGLPENRCAVDEKHISGIAMMLPIPLFLAGRKEGATETALEHLSLTHAGKKMRTAAKAILSILVPVLKGESLVRDHSKGVLGATEPPLRIPFLQVVR